MAFTPVLATLGFILSEDRQSVLMVHRIARERDLQYGYYNGLGGKLEPGEDIVECIKREILEESGLTVESIQLRGTVSWPGYGDDCFGFIFLIDGYSGEPYASNEEGELSWQPISRLSELHMMEGDRNFVPLVFDETVGQFHVVIPYQNGVLTGFSVTLL